MIKKSAGGNSVDTFLSPFSIVDYHQSDAIAFGKNDHILRSKGIPIVDMDTLITSQAISNEFILITNNVKHYSRVPGLKYESWK